MRVVELFCGIGGFAEALAHEAPEAAEVVMAIDLAEHPLEVYRAMRAHPTRQVDIARMAPEAFVALEASLWWMSPPCQPYTTRGHRLDLDDRRAASLRHLLEAVLPVAAPRWLAMENVEGFRGSRAHALLWTTLEGLGYDIDELALCPSALGIPNRRPRYYLVASRAGELRRPEPEAAVPMRALSSFVDPRHDDDPALYVAPEHLARHGPGMRILDLEADPASVANCFTSAYGKTFQAAGAYLLRPDGVRRFAPAEIAALLGFSPDFAFPDQVSLKRRWRHLGNSLSIWAVREVIRRLPCIPQARDVLRSERLVLRPYRESDHASFVALQADAQVRRHMGGPLNAGRADALFWRLFGRPGIWAICSPEGDYLGHVFLEHHEQGRQLGIMLAPPSWGRGLAGEAIATLQDRCAAGQIVIADCDRDHMASRRMLERAGFVLHRWRRDQEGDYPEYRWIAPG